MVESKAQVMGHPLHPMLVMFPVAFFPLALVMDVVWLVRGDALWASLAFWSALAGTALGIVAAVPGLIDYAGVVPRGTEARKVATKHMITGLTLLALGILTVLLRYLAGAWTVGDAQSLAVAMPLWWAAFVANLAVNGLLVLQGWWGGELVYKHHIGVEPLEARATRALPQAGLARDDDEPDRRGVPGGRGH